MYTDYDVIVLGAGAAGLSAAIYTSRAGWDTAVFEKKSFGGEAVNRQLLENYPGFANGIMGPELAAALTEQAENAGAELEIAEVDSIRDKGSHKVVTLDGGGRRVTCKGIIVATGSHPRLLDVPGEAELTGHGVFYCATCDGPACAGKPVVVSGGGSSAFTEALHLEKLGCHVTIVCRSTPRAEQVLQDRVEENPNIDVLCNTDIVKIDGDDWVTGVQLRDKTRGDEWTVYVSGVYVRIGQIPNTEFLKDTITLTPAGQIPVGPNMSTEMAGLYAAGDIRTDSPMQMSTAAGDGAAAGIALGHYLNTLD